MLIFDILGRIKKTFSKVESLFSFSILNASTRFNSYTDDRRKLAVVLNNPAVLKVFSLQCDLFSLGKVYVKDKDGNIIDDDPFLKLLARPNPFQSEAQFKWDFMFNVMLGTSYCYSDSKIVDKKGNKLYSMSSWKLEWPQDMERQKDKFIFSDDQVNRILKTNLTYRYEDGSPFTFPLDRLIISTDLTNGIGNFFKGPSRIDALYKVISNSEYALDSKNINVRYSGKFLVGATDKLNTVGLGQSEKDDIADKMDTDKTVWPIGKPVTIKRFVENMAQLALDDSFRADYFLIGSMYGIPRDVLEASLEGSTYENQEKSRAAHVSYCLSPKGDEWMNSFERHYGYDATGRNICMDWNHLPLMQVFEKEKLDKQKVQVDTFLDMVKQGIPQDQANGFLGTSFEIPPPETVIGDNASPETLEAQATLRGSVGGVQGILEVQASVAAGTTSRSAAINILTIVYGFTEQQANDLLGKPEGQSGGAEGQPAGEGQGAEQ